MQDALAEGLSTAEAARRAIAEVPVTPTPVTLDEGRQRLAAALDDFDATSAHTTLDALLAGNDTDAVLGQVVLPYLHDLGRRWESGEVDVTQEHFASNLLRARVAALAQDRADGPTALLACPPGELHDLPLLVLAVGLGRRGWRVVFLGADVPMADLTHTAHSIHPDLVVLAATSEPRLTAVADRVTALARATTVAVAGAGAGPDLAKATGTLLLAEDPVTAAGRLDDLIRTAGHKTNRTAR
jgi:methanogenic corrinoid protein MtbC1